MEGEEQAAAQKDWWPKQIIGRRRVLQFEQSAETQPSGSASVLLATTNNNNPPTSNSLKAIEKALQGIEIQKKFIKWCSSKGLHDSSTASQLGKFDKEML